MSGKLVDADYRRFVPEAERLIARHGKIRILFDMDDFHGWDAKALWDDFEFGVRHSADLERLAMIGEKKWQEWMAKIWKPFTSATIRYFNRAAADEARAWIEEGVK